MPRILPLIASAAMSFVVLTATATPAFAQRGGPDYRLTTAAPMSGTAVAGDTLWRCDATGCSASASTSRPAVTCAQAAKKVGRLDSFSFRGQAFDEAALAKCNEKAS
jgi:hypothetical protein